VSQIEPVPLKLLLDQGILTDAARLFRELGYECHFVSELGMQRAEDEDILSLAQARGCVVITLDADFHAVRGCPDRRLFDCGEKAVGPKRWSD
jgi:predicted nuclease of predicted toxin-antitoxin system